MTRSHSLLTKNPAPTRSSFFPLNRLTALLLTFLCLYSLPVHGQDDDEPSEGACNYAPESKVQKLLEKAQDRKKYDSEKRRAFYEDALDLDEDCLPCLMALGDSEFKRAKRNRSSFAAAKAYLSDLVDKCPNYHPDAYFNLGAMHYADRAYDEAQEAFEAFLHFPDEDGKYDNDKQYLKKYDEVQEVMPFVRFHKDFNRYRDAISVAVVDGVSSSAEDYLPALSPDGEIMFYTRRSQKKAKGDLVSRDVEEFTWSKRADINAQFDKGDPLPQPFNLGDSYGGASISVDNKELFIAKRHPVDGNPENIDLFVTRYQYGYDETKGENTYTWSELEHLGSAVNTDMGWESQPSLSGDGKTLYFATVRANSIPDANGNPSSDIFYSERQSDGSWSEAKSIGDINTAANEKAPFMHSDSKTLYFASDRQPGGGGFDLWYTRQNEDGSWTEAKNLGAPINTEDDEHGMIVSADAEEAYFASKRPGGVRGLDIFSFKLPEEARPEKVLILKGKLSNEGGKIPEDAKVEIKYVQSQEVEAVEVNQDDGVYATVVNVSRGEDVLVSVSAENQAFNSHVVVNREEANPASVVKLDVKTEEAKAAKSFVIPDINYATNSADIDRVSQLILDEFADYLIKNPGISVEIGGHTDNRGSTESNLALSMDRAFEVKGYLERKGVPGDRVKAKGYGPNKPVASNDSAEGRAQNRRTEFTILRMR